MEEGIGLNTVLCTGALGVLALKGVVVFWKKSGFSKLILEFMGEARGGNPLWLVGEGPNLLKRSEDGLLCSMPLCSIEVEG